MNRSLAFRAALLALACWLAACASLNTPPPATPAQTVVVEPAQASPTAASPTVERPTADSPTAAPSATAMPSATAASATASATAQTPPGTALAFDRLSLVVPNGLAAGGSGAIVPEAKGESVAPWDVAPEHIQYTLDGYALNGKLFQPQIFIYPAEAYAQLQERGTAAQSLARLRDVLAQSAMIDMQALPQVPFFNVSQALAAQVKVIPFQNGQGVRMVTEYAMARAIINNHELFYHFEGLTSDGQWYVVAILPVTAPGLPEDGQPGSAVPPGGVAVPDFNDLNANWIGYYGDVRQMLQGYEAGAFTPSLDQLDALIGSLSIAAPGQ